MIWLLKSQINLGCPAHILLEMVSQVRRGPCIEKSISIPIFNYTKWKTFRCIPISNQYCKKQISSWKLPMQSKHHNDQSGEYFARDFHISPNLVENGKVLLKFYSLDTNPPPVGNRENCQHGEEPDFYTCAVAIKTWFQFRLVFYQVEWSWDIINKKWMKSNFSGGEMAFLCFPLMVGR